MWAMSSEKWVDSPRLPLHLEWLLEQLEPHQAAITDILANGATADFFCYSIGRTSIPPAIPRVIRGRSRALGFTIEVDHYDSSNDAGN